MNLPLPTVEPFHQPTSQHNPPPFIPGLRTPSQTDRENEHHAISIHSKNPENIQKDKPRDFYNPESNPIGENRDELIEIKTFLPAHPEKMISSRYENPLIQLKTSTKRWKAMAFLLAAFSFVYFALNLYTTLTFFDDRILTDTPQAIKTMSSYLLEMQDLLFYSYTMNLVMDIWALVIYLVVIGILLKESSSQIEPSPEERSRFARILRKISIISVVLFGMSYIVGTGLLLHVMYYEVRTNDMVPLLIFHLGKTTYLLSNVIAFRKYKGKKFVYEDLLLEALGPSDHGDDRTESEENNEEH